MHTDPQTLENTVEHWHQSVILLKDNYALTESV